uniref:Maculatin-3.1 n=1 Tax=Ranoidea genimaculata TaxID=95132 RepID=MCU31_RANGE|nr:RecName: Full=Maculatin-3.1 [Ranoidea genimaculata]
GLLQTIKEKLESLESLAKGIVSGIQA